MGSIYRSFKRCLFVLFVASTAGHADFAPPGRVETVEVAVATQHPGTLSVAGARIVELVAPSKQLPVANSPMRTVGVGRVFAREGLEEIDVATLTWSKGAKSQVATLVVRSSGAVQIRVGMRIARPAPSLEIAVSSVGSGNTLLISAVWLSESASRSDIIWTPVTQGEAQVIEFTVRAEDHIPKGSVVVFGASHLSESITNAPMAKSVGDSLSCQIDVSCVSNSPSLPSDVKQAFDNKINSTALLVVTQANGNTGTCTGTLLNGDYKVPIFITASHCVPDSDAANSVVTVWNFQRDVCGAVTWNPGVVRSNGAILLSVRRELDSSLILLRDLPPSNAILSGWEAGASIASGTQMLGMHHPRGDLKKTSVGTVTGIAGSFVSSGYQYPSSSFYTTNWQVGLVEPGSSGSGLFIKPQNQSFLALVGMLNSGPATGLTCAGSTTYENKFTRLDLFYPYVRRFFRKNYSTNYSDLWWTPAESGWGLNVQHQGDTLFATWFTFAEDGRGMWLVVSSAELIAPNTYRGDIYRTSGTPFNLINGAPAIDPSPLYVGTMTIQFLNDSSAQFSYTVNGFAATKIIERLRFSAPTTCEFTLSSRSSATNYQDLWWNAAESGWGINLTHQGDKLFATWFTYDVDRSGMWLVMPDSTRIAPNVFQGTLYRARGTPLRMINGKPAAEFPLSAVGSITFTFTDGGRGTMNYIVNGFSGTKQIERLLFALPASRCQ